MYTYISSIYLHIYTHRKTVVLYLYPQNRASSSQKHMQELAPGVTQVLNAKNVQMLKTYILLSLLRELDKDISG